MNPPPPTRRQAVRLLELQDQVGSLAQVRLDPVSSHELQIRRPLKHHHRPHHTDLSLYSLHSTFFPIRCK